MKTTHVQSSTIKHVRFDAETGKMQVTFASGHTYEYTGIEPSEHDALVSADSVGAHFSKHIRPNFKGQKQ